MIFKNRMISKKYIWLLKLFHIKFSNPKNLEFVFVTSLVWKIQDKRMKKRHPDWYNNK